MANKNRGALLGGILIGTAIGVVAGLLTAPRKGKETRKILKKTADAVPQMAEDLASSVKLQTDRLSEVALDNWYDTLDRLQAAISAGVEASTAARKRYVDNDDDDDDDDNDESDLLSTSHPSDYTP
jgi:gas vesicle protein